MNSAIFIGPYRQYDYVGTSSNIFLHSIHKELKKYDISLFSRPLFLNNALVNPNNIDYSLYENINLDPIEFSVCIQHAPTEYLATQYKWKNIAIPILDPKIHKASVFNNLQKLNEFDAVLVSSEQEKNVLLKSSISSKIYICDENLLDHTSKDILNNRYDLGSLSDDEYNFGFIGSYTENLSIINKTVLSFLVAFRSDSNLKLHFFLRGTQTNKNEIEKFYHETLKQLQIYNYNNISFTFSSLDLEASIASLNSTNCLLAINDDINMHIYENYMKRLNRAVINKGSVDTIQVPTTFVDYRYDIDDLLSSISTLDLISKMRQSIDKSRPIKNKVANNPTMGATVCRILQ